MAEPAKRTIRGPNTFDFLRFLAATVVVVAHASALLGDSILSGPASIVDGVAMFFIISGFLVYRSAERALEKSGEWKEFFRNRFLRVAPALYVYTVLVAILLVVTGAVSVSAMFSKGVAIWMIGSFLFVPTYDPSAFSSFGTGQLNSALYTIPAEVSFYLLIPILFFVARRFGFNWMLAMIIPVAVLSPIVGFEAGGTVSKVLNNTCLERMAYFGIGVFWVRYWPRVPKHWGLFVLAIVSYLLIKELMPESLDARLHPVFISVPLSYMILWFAYNGPKALASFTDRIGDISYGTYIWHLPIINFFIWKGLTGAWTVPVALVTAWLFGAASWWFVERRALTLKRVSERMAETGELIPGQTSIGKAANRPVV